MKSPSSSLLASIALLAFWTIPAAAQQPTTSLNTDRPWIKRVSLEHQKAATRLFDEGNTLLQESRFEEAEKKYSEALSHWNHPAIHYNLALALPATLRPTEIYSHMLASMVHGEAPLGTDRFKYAHGLTERMKQEYAWVEISCDCEASATLASGRWLVRQGGGRFEGLVPPGTHTLIATRKGYPSTEMTLTVAAGDKLNFRLDASRPWAAWKPWTLVGAGVAAAAGGGFLNNRARSHMRVFDAGIKECGGCVPSPSLAGEHKRGLLFSRASTGVFTLGGAAVLTGLVLAYTNQVQSQLIPTDEIEPSLVIAPVLGAQEEGLLATFRF